MAARTGDGTRPRIVPGPLAACTMPVGGVLQSGLDSPKPSLWLAALVAACCMVSGCAEPPAARPNVLFISVDDLNDWIGCLRGHPQALTPNIDRLASRGILFANAHTAAPACNPSRAAVFSGRMPHTTGIWSNDRGQRLHRTFPEGRLLTSAFREAGYSVWGAGKLLHSGGGELFEDYLSVNQRWSPLPRESVDYTPDELPTKGSPDPRHVTADSQGRTVVLPLNRMPSDRRPDTPGGESFDWGGFDVPDSDFGDTQITNWAIEKISRPREKPFFLGVGYYRPHIPLWAPQRFFDRFADSPGELPPVEPGDLDDLSETARAWALEAVTAGSHATVVEHGQWRAAVEAYLASVTYVDHEIGRLLDALDKSPARQDTVIVLWSDHGWHLGEKEHWGKWTGWERSTRVPLIMVPPAHESELYAVGETSSRPAGLIDIYPTLVELTRIQGPGQLDGQSLVPSMRDPLRSTDRAVVTMFDRNNVSLRTERWRYIRYEDGAEELYDHQDDPHEWVNLAGDQQHAGQLGLMREKAIPYLTAD